MRKNIKYIIFLLVLTIIPIIKVRAADINLACDLYCFATEGRTEECINNCNLMASEMIRNIETNCSYVCIDDEECISSCSEQYISSGNIANCDTDCANNFFRKFISRYNANHNSVSSNISNHCLQSCNYDYTCVPSCVESVRNNCSNACGQNKNTFCVNDCVNDYANSSYFCIEAGCDNDFFSKYNIVLEQENNNSNNNSGSSSSNSNDGSIEKTPLTCEDVRYATFAYNALRIIAPFLLIIFGSLDFFKAITAGDIKKQQEAKSKFPKRIIAFLLLIILPFVIGYLFKMFGNFGSSNLGVFCCIVSNGDSNCNVVIENGYNNQVTNGTKNDSNKNSVSNSTNN